jgi:hypothetical protein
MSHANVFLLYELQISKTLRKWQKSTLLDIEYGKDNHTLRWLGEFCNSMLTHNLTIDSTNISGFVDIFTFDGLVVVCSASVSKHL